MFEKDAVEVGVDLVLCLYFFLVSFDVGFEEDKGGAEFFSELRAISHIKNTTKWLSKSTLSEANITASYNYKPFICRGIDSLGDSITVL